MHNIQEVDPPFLSLSLSLGFNFSLLHAVRDGLRFLTSSKQIPGTATRVRLNIARISLIYGQLGVSPPELTFKAYFGSNCVVTLDDKQGELN